MIRRYILLWLLIGILCAPFSPALGHQTNKVHPALTWRSSQILMKEFPNLYAEISVDPDPDNQEMFKDPPNNTVPGSFTGHTHANDLAALHIWRREGFF